MGKPAVNAFIRQLASHSALDRTDRAALRSLPWQSKAVGSRRDLTRIGEAPAYCHIVGQGLIGSFQQLADGRRQIVSIYVAGEMINPQAIMAQDARTGLNALTQSSVEQVTLECLRDIAARFPSVGQALWRETSIGAQMLAKSIVSIGRKSACARIAYFLCEVGERFARTQGADRCTFQLAMFQDQIAEMLGMTAVHVNRMFSELKADNLISVCGREVTIIDFARLAWLGEYEPSDWRVRERVGTPQPHRSDDILTMTIPI